MKTRLEGLLNWKVLGDNVLAVKFKEADRTAGGIALPGEIMIELPRQAEIVSVGPGKRFEGKLDRAPMNLAPGQRIVYHKSKGVPVKYEGIDLILISAHDIMGTITTDEKWQDINSKSVRLNPDNIQPYGRHLLIDREEKETVSAGGIIYPDTYNERNLFCKLLKVGLGQYLIDGTYIPAIRANIGDELLVRQFEGMSVSRLQQDLTLVEGIFCDGRRVNMIDDSRLDKVESGVVAAGEGAKDDREAILS